MHRRQFLSLASAAPMLTLPWATTLQAAPSDVSRRSLLVLIYLKGGNDAYNTFVPLNDARYRRLRPTIGISREQLIPFSATHGFNPALKSLLPAWESREIALLQGIGQEEVTNQHYRDLEMQFTASSLGNYYSDGWVTRAFGANAARNLRGKSELDALAFGDLDIREADPMGPFRGNKIRVINMQHPSEWIIGQKVAGTLHLESTPARVLAESYAQPQRITLATAFPANEFGDALRAAAELAAAGMAPPVIHVSLTAVDDDQHHAFDTHWEQNKYHTATLTKLAEGLASFRDAMREIGQWNDTLVATYDEFGRSPKENIKQGTDHGWSSTHMVMGGKVKGGLFGAPMPVIDVFAIDGPAPVIDYRELYTTIIEQWWGGNATGVFERKFKSLDLLRS
ncbi:MAG: DUF1501 domain-containing protein [Betaproteobacteria bacterium]